MASEFSEYFPRRHIPEYHSFVHSTRTQLGVVTTALSIQNIIPMGIVGLEKFIGVWVPQLERFVTPASEAVVAIS
jgi:hypothetical protein